MSFGWLVGPLVGPLVGSLVGPSVNPSIMFVKKWALEYWKVISLPTYPWDSSDSCGSSDNSDSSDSSNSSDSSDSSDSSYKNCVTKIGDKNLVTKNVWLKLCD